MKKGIISSRCSYSTIKKIANSLEDMGVQLFRSIRNNLNPPPSETFDILIRWGCTSTSVPVDESSVIYNPRDSIRSNTNKLKARKILEENNIPIPKTWGLDESPVLPVIARPLRHFGGKNFYYCETVQQLYQAINDGCQYFSEFFPKEEEFRCHTFLGRCLILQKKLSEEGIDSRNPWNLSNCHISKFKTIRWGEYPKYQDVINVAIDATKALGLTFAAVDVMKNSEKTVITELNTAPRLSNYGRKRYSEAFRYLLSSSTPRRWFPEDIEGGNRLRHYELEV